jgi:endonuclease/exonuclease/phosphatase family metal-dependent hydrolase
MVSVQVATGSGPMWFSATHLSHLPDEGWVREAQVVAIADALDDMAGDVPPVVCGDMNSTAASPEVRFLTGQAQLGDRRCELIDAYLAANPHELGATWSHRNPNVGGSHKKDRRIDFIMAGQPRADGVGRVLASTLVCDEPRQGAWPSDHFGVMADLVGE